MSDYKRGLAAVHDVLEDITELLEALQHQNDPTVDVREQLPVIRERLLELLVDVAKLYAATR